MIFIWCIVEGKFGRSAHGLCNFKIDNGLFEARAFAMYLMFKPGVIFMEFLYFLNICFFNKTIDKIQYIYKGQLYSHEEGVPLPTSPIKTLYWKM